MIKTECFCVAPMDANCYFLTDEASGDVAVVDLGAPAGEAFQKLLSCKDHIRYLLFTHRHCDHILGAKAAKEITDAEIAIHELDACGLTSERDSLFSSFRYLYGYKQEAVTADRLLHDGDCLPLGESTITVMETPGHTKGSVCFLYDQSMLTGDLLFENSIGRTDFPTGSFDDMVKSIAKLRTLTQDYTLYPGHGRKTTLSRELAFNPYIPR